MIRLRKFLGSVWLILFPLVIAGCGTTRHVPAGEKLLDDVSIQVKDSTGGLSSEELYAYVRQRPNHKMFWSAKFRLGLYNMSGNDSTKWWNKWLRSLGEPPVIYSARSTEGDKEQLRKAMVNAGYLHPEVTVDSTINRKGNKIKLRYKLDPGTPHVISSITYEFPNDTIREAIMADSSRFTVKPGSRLDRTLLEQQRDIITNSMRDRGFFAFGKEYISFNADTTAGSYDVDLTMMVMPQRKSPDDTRRSLRSHVPYLVRHIYYIMDYQPSLGAEIAQYPAKDTVEYKGLTILYGDHHYLRPGVLYENCFIRPAEPYSMRQVNNTYASLSRLSILKFINIRFLPVGDPETTGLLDAYILLTPGKSQSFSVELEGTNSEGDLGVAAGLTYTHRNIGKGSETFSAKVRGAYESISGNLSGLINNRYMEYSVETNLTFPKFKAPFLHENFKRRIKASTEFNISLNYQERPEYTRIISTAGWSYRWTQRGNANRHILTPIDINYVYLPKSTNNFLDQIAPDNPLLRYSYEDHFIMRLGYTIYHTNKRPELPWQTDVQKNIYTVRANIETAGNLLFGLSSLFNHRSNFHNDPYKVFGIHYSQYVRGEGDFSFIHIFDRRQSLAWHVGAGIGVPYGNSSILPFEKRFYGGGANGVRGWSVRTLGPGRFPGTNSVSDFINQCGDIRIEGSVEYRAKLFWVIEGALFLDAGNIWTIRSYETQPDGTFRFNAFYKEFAAAYGAGIRFDFSYFLLRFDLGVKLHDPAINREPWPVLHPNWRRDTAFHFSIGYPF